MKKLLLFFTLLSSFLFCKIIDITSIKEVEKYILDECLVIFDLDNTILELKQELGCDQWFDSRFNHYLKSGFEKKDALLKTYDEWHKIQSVSSVKAVEKHTKTVFDSLLDKKNVMGLTTRGYNISYTTFAQLRSINIDFTKKPIHCDEIFFNNGRGVLFSNNILFTNGTHKGKALFTFLDKIKHTPKKIVFINDKKKHLEEIEEISLKNKVDFIGLRYGYLDEKVKNLHPDIIRIKPINFNSFLIKKQKRALKNK